MAERAVRKLEQNGIPLPCPVDDFTRLVIRYGKRSSDRPPLPLSDIERWARDAGFDIEMAVPVGEVVAKASDHAPGPFPTERGPRMWFQLRRA